MKEKILKFVIDKAKRNKFVQSVFEQPLDMNDFPVKGIFRDSRGNEHKLYNGFRTKIKPAWERIFEQEAKSFDKSSQRVEKIAQNGRIAVERLLPIIDLYLSGIENSRILEVGCNSGGAALAFAEMKARKVVGTEFSGYKIEALDNTTEIEKYALNEVNENLKDLRNLVGKKFAVDESKITFEDDDICDSKLPHNSFDLICSWDVLEHIHNPSDAFKNISKLLSDNGVAIQEYNPFFSLSGGHSACTIDFPWGHVILDDNDFNRFNEEIQPDRLNTSMSFYRNGLNRMTINDLKNYCKEANLDIISIIKFPKEQHLRMLDKKTLNLAKNNYSNLELDDLITPKIIVIFKKSNGKK